MTAAAVQGTARFRPGADALFRLLGVFLQIAATLAIAHTLTPFQTGLFFEGFVVTLAGAAFVRAKLDIYLGRHIVAGLAASTGISDATLLRVLSKRFVKRSSLICAALLVIIADADLMAQSLYPYLSTFIPFVLALPFVGYATMMGGALRAANRYLMSLICTAYVMNSAILLAVLLAPEHPPVALFSWIFFGGSVVGAGVAHLFTRRIFGMPEAQTAATETTRAAWKAIEGEIHEGAGVGFANAAVLWAPLCLLVVLAPATEMAMFAVSTRTAQLILYAMPVIALLVAPRIREQSAHFTGQFGRAALWKAIGGVAAASAIMAAALIAGAGWSLAQYGPAYEAALAVYIALVIAETFSVIGRPLFRYHATHWNARDAGRVLFSAAGIAVLVTLALMPWLKAFAAALGLAAGHITAVALGTRSALRQPA